MTPPAWRAAATLGVLLVLAGCAADRAPASPAGTVAAAPATAPSAPDTAASAAPSTPGAPSGQGAVPAAGTTRWPVPRTGDDTVAALARMPTRLGEWTRARADRGTVVYRSAGRELVIEAGELGDMYAEDVAPAEAIRRITLDLDAGSARPCPDAAPLCVTGTVDGRPHMAWTKHGSQVVMIAAWPDPAARDLLHAAWLAAAG